MANCIASVDRIQPSGNDVSAVFDLVFTGSDMPSGPAGSQLDVVLSSGATVTQLRTAVSSAITAYALSEFGITVAPGNMILPSFSKG